MLSWSSCLSKGGTVPIPPVTLQRFVACAAALAVFAAMATTPPPTARAADGRELLANAIATTRGAYLVYNFGGGAPAPMLSAGGGWYEMSNGGHLMIIKSASQRLAGACSSIRTPAIKRGVNGIRGRAPVKACGRPPRSTPRCRLGKRLVSRRLRSTPTSSTYGARRAGRGSQRDAVLRLAPTSTTPAGKGAPTQR